MKKLYEERKQQKNIKLLFDKNGFRTEIKRKFKLY